MQLSSLDVGVVMAYIVLIFSIAVSANVYMKKHFLSKRKDGLKPIENHYLAGRSISFPEAVLSIIATEFSAMAFLIIPTYVYMDNFSYFKFVIGAVISRCFISWYFIPKIYGKGLTIFEVLARGIYGYSDISKEGHSGKKTFAAFYIFTKLIGVSVKLLGGSILVAEFFGISVFFAMVVIALLTYLYIILGGLKAVVRTDMIQAMIFILGGFVANYVVGKMSSFTWGELAIFGFESGKFSPWTDWSGFLSFLYGILAGIAYDAATHGVDQDLTQKFLGAKDMKTAQRALAWSSAGSLFVNLIFLTLGVVIWSYYTKHGQPLPRPDKIFSSLIENYFPTPIKGLMVASILAASMSTLDSSINALSAVFWNDLMGGVRSKMFRIYINLDNFIITVSIIVVAHLFSLVPGAMKFGIHFAYLSTAPLLSFFICRMMLSKWIKISYTPTLIILSIFTCFLGMAMNQFRFGFNPHLTILIGIITTILFMWIYSLLSDFSNTPKENKYE
jgi:solute:Na+ symporter, SSS family